MVFKNWKYKSEPFSPGDLVKLGLNDGYIPGWFGPKGPSTLKDRWEANEGVFLFFKMSFSIDNQKKEVEISKIESRLQDFLKDAINNQVRFLWVENPTAPVSQWRSNSISVEVMEDPQDAKKLIRQVSSRTYLDLHNYSLSIDRETVIDPNNSSDQFIFTSAKNNHKGIGFRTGHGLHQLNVSGSSATLDMTGDFRGCFQFDLDLKMALLNGGKSFGYPGLSQLDISLRIFFRDPDFPEPGDKFYLASHRYPIFDETHPLLDEPSDDPNISAPSIKDANHPLKNEVTSLLNPLDKNPKPWLQKAFNYYPDQISFSVKLDLLYPLAEERTHFIFKNLGSLYANLGLPSAYRTNLGYRVHLIPKGTESRLHLAPRPSLFSDKNGHTVPFYLVPAGNFEMRIPIYQYNGIEDFKSVVNVDCGISGVEYIKIEYAADLSIPSAIMTFVPNQPAYAPSHVSVSALLRDFPTILKLHTKLELHPDTTDQDSEIPNKREDLTIGGPTVDYLEIILRDYFPKGFSFTKGQSAEYNKLERVEELVEWLKNALITSGKGTGNLSDQASTSWVYIRQGEKEGEGAVYYSQPEQALLYKAEPSSVDFLDFLEIPSVGLPLKPGNQGIPLAFPMLPYGDVDPYALADLKLLEVSLINNFRRNRIQEISADTGHKTSLKLSSKVKQRGTTPQGLIATFSENYRDIERLELARDTHEPIPKLIPFVDIKHGTPLKAALQSNQLFMVISDSKALSTNFKKDIVDKIDDLANNLDATTSMEIKKWIFELGTESWDKFNRNTILIFKFHDKPLIELAANPELWSFPGHFNGKNEGEVSATMMGLLNNAVEIGNRVDPKESGKYEVLAQVATQANWTGILAFNVHVPPNGLPPELMALAAGIEPELFYAQYVGIELTRVTSDGSNLKPEGSSLFGLIDYSNPEISVATNSGYNFHVASLTVVFENSRIKDFSAEILIVVEKLFDEPCRLLNSSNNIISLIGVAEEHNGKITYSFGFKGSNRFKLSGHALEEVEIVKTQFVTDPIPDLTANTLKITGRFIFWSRIRFAYFDKFDILSFGGTPNATSEDPDYLSFSNLQIVMEFNLVSNATTKPVSTFTFNPHQMAFDLEKSGWRKQSLYEKFPLIFRGFLIGKSDNSVQSGFLDVNTPLEPVVLGDKGVKWYGMAFSLNMESSEDLGAKAKIKADILVGWNVGQKGIYVGLKFPGSSGTERSITIVGLLKLTFKTIRFVVYPLTVEWEDGVKQIPENSEREVGYLLNLKNIRLEFFKLFFPPTGRTEITLFGDPREDIEREKRLVGWYAAYVKK